MGTLGRQAGYTYIADHSSAALDQLLIVVFVGCYTANTELPAEGGRGNLITGSEGKGADCAIGFKDQVYYPNSGFHRACGFWQSLAEGAKVKDALADGEQAVRDWSGGNAYGYDSFDVAGADGIKLIPARFGQ